MKHKLISTPQDRQRGGFDIKTRKSKIETAVVAPLALLSTLAIVHASHESRQVSDNEGRVPIIPANTFDYSPGNNDAQQITQDLAKDNDPKMATYIVDAAGRPHAK